MSGERQSLAAASPTRLWGAVAVIAVLVVCVIRAVPAVGGPKRQPRPALRLLCDVNRSIWTENSLVDVRWKSRGLAGVPVAVMRSYDDGATWTEIGRSSAGVGL